jgi:hypothetical protein
MCVGSDHQDSFTFSRVAANNVFEGVGVSIDGCSEQICCVQNKLLFIRI